MKPAEPYPPDQLPKTYRQRIFIGGNYDHIGELHDVRDLTEEVIAECGLDMVTILPLDSCVIPPNEIHDWDLRILHNCRYAIFEVSNPGGELMEIERAGSEFKTKTLLLFQAKTVTEERPRHVTTMLMQSGPHTVRGWTYRHELKRVIRDFLTTPDEELFQSYISVIGFEVKRLETFITMHADGSSDHTWSYEGIKAHHETVTGIRREMYSSHSKVENVAVEPTDIVEWIEDKMQSTEKMKLGWIRFKKEGGLRGNDPPIDCKLKFRPGPSTFVFNRADIESRYRGHPLPYESVGAKIDVPVDHFSMYVEFFEGFRDRPEIASTLGATVFSQADTLQNMEDSFDYDEQRRLARLVIRRPRLFRLYEVYWAGT